MVRRAGRVAWDRVAVRRRRCAAQRGDGLGALMFAASAAEASTLCDSGASVYSGMKDAVYPCPCCGFLMFHGLPGSYEICEICFWEDDGLQLEFATTLAGGANGQTLQDAQRAYAAGFADLTSGFTRPPAASDRRDPDWRPIDRLRDEFPDWDAADRKRAPANDERLYYWRPTFWNRDRASHER